MFLLYSDFSLLYLTSVTQTVSGKALRKDQKHWSPLGWAEGLLWVGGLEVNETRPNLAFAPPRAARSKSETPSLFRATRTLPSASGTTAYLTKLRSWKAWEREREREKEAKGWQSKFVIQMCHLNGCLDLNIIKHHRQNCVNILTNHLLELLQLKVYLTSQFRHFYNHLIFTLLSLDTRTTWLCNWLWHDDHNSLQ